MMNLSFGKKLMLAATMAVLVSGGIAVCNTVQTEAASSKASGFTYESGAMRFSQLVNMGSINSCLGGPRDFQTWARGNARISGRNIIMGSGPQALVYHVRPGERSGMLPIISSLSTTSGIEIAKYKPYEVRNVSVSRIDTNKNLTIYLEHDTPDAYSTEKLIVRGVTKEGKVYTYVDCYKVLDQHFNVGSQQLAFENYNSNQTCKVQGNSIYIPFEIGPRDGYYPNNLKGTLVLDWNESANWFSYRIQ